MRLLLRIAMILLLARGAWAEEAAPVPDAPEPLPVPRFVTGDTVCFVGDSITRWDQAYHATISAVWLTRHPEVRVRYVNSGISGHSAAYVLNRFDYDVAAWSPTYLTVMLGMNDVGWRHYEADVKEDQRNQGRREAARRWTVDFARLLDRLQGLQPRALVVISPTVYDEYTEAAMRVPARVGTDADLETLGEIAASLAAGRRLPYLDWRTPLLALFAREQQRDPAFSLTTDRSHPTALTQVFMAHVFLSAQGVEPWYLDVALNGATGQVVRQTGATLTAVAATEREVRFRYTPAALPFRLPEPLHAARDLLHGQPNYESSERLQVTDLPVGLWRLAIDGVELGTYRHERLATGLELTALPHFPDLAQATAVQQLNAKRLQHEARTARLYVEVRGRLPGLRAKAKVDEKPLPEDDVAAALALAERESIPSQQDYYRTYAELATPAGIARWQAELAAYHDQLYQLNQPPTRTVTLTWVP